MPAFWLGMLLIILFAVELGWLPAGGTASLDGGGPLTGCSYLALPVLTLTLLTAGVFVRFVRAPCSRPCASPSSGRRGRLGCGEARVLLRHALPHAMLPVVTMIALSFGSLFSGALVVETTFAYLGVGKLIYDAILGSDFNLALLALMLATIVTLASNLAADLAYAWLDPRISYACLSWRWAHSAGPPIPRRWQQVCCSRPGASASCGAADRGMARAECDVG